ncbi:MAG TPA: hypothetical protein VM536_11745 [Chloroflexia bacterium]|nr:hypothetical protein [Chloroflexia bacterium]
MKKFVLAMAMLFVCVLAIWVAFRLASETWAMIAGVVFGLLASLPMCGVVLVMLMRGSKPQPAPPVYHYTPYGLPPQEQVPPGYRPSFEATPAGYYLPAGPAPVRAARPAAPRTFVEPIPYRYQGPPDLDADSYDVDDADGWDVPEPASWEPPARPRQARILGH